jgi:hypothetical protein
MRAHPGDGTMDVEELGTVFVSLGTELNDRELQKVGEHLCPNNSTANNSTACILSDNCFFTASFVCRS